MARPLNLLFVTPYLPSPPGFGGQRRIHGLIEGLSRAHTVSVLSLVNPADAREASPSATRAYCKQVVTVPNRAFALSSRGKRLLQLRSLGSRRSFEWLSHVTPTLLAGLRDLLARNSYDVVTFEFSHLAPYRRWLSLPSKRPVFVLDEHNIEYEILRRTASGPGGMLRSVYNAVNLRKLRREEQHAWRLFDGTTVTSAHDQSLLLRDAPGTKTAVVPNAVDLDYFRPRPAPPPGKTILFFGANNYFPNADGLAFFLRESFPLLRQLVPGVRLRVVGHTPPELMASLASEEVEMAGFVDDVRVELERAAVVIAPLRIGGGTRLKILEAMSMGRPVVSTRQGAEGIMVAHERELLLADEPVAFAQAVARVLGDLALAIGLGKSARGLVERAYGWGAAVNRLESFYRELLPA